MFRSLYRKTTSRESLKPWVKIIFTFIKNIMVNIYKWHIFMQRATPVKIKYRARLPRRGAGNNTTTWLFYKTTRLTYEISFFIV